MKHWGLGMGLGLCLALVVGMVSEAAAEPQKDFFRSIFGRRIMYPEKVLLEDFQRPLDREMTEKLVAIEKTGLFKLVERLVKSILDDILTQQHLVFGVELRPDQFPDRKDLHRIVEDCARILDIPKPRVFFVDLPITNAYVSNYVEPIIVLSSSVLRLIDDPGELRFIIGHEMGHIRARHLKWKAYLNVVMEHILDPMPIPDSAKILPYLPLFKWAREAEMSADNAGLICCQDLKAAERALLRVTLNIEKKNIGRINVDSFLRQRENEDFSKFSEVMIYWLQLQQEHPFLDERIRQLRQYSESRAYRHLWER